MEDLTRYEHPMSPVRDDTALSPAEDLDREPDGIPHSVIAGTAGMLFVIAALLFGLLTGHVPVVTSILVALGILGFGMMLNKIAQTHRTAGRHASR